MPGLGRVVQGDHPHAAGRALPLGVGPGEGGAAVAPRHVVVTALVLVVAAAAGLKNNFTICVSLRNFLLCDYALANFPYVCKLQVYKKFFFLNLSNPPYRGSGVGGGLGPGESLLLLGPEEGLLCGPPEEGLGRGPGEEPLRLPPEEGLGEGGGQGGQRSDEQHGPLHLGWGLRRRTGAEKGFYTTNSIVVVVIMGWGSSEQAASFLADPRRGNMIEKRTLRL